MMKVLIAVVVICILGLAVESKPSGYPVHVPPVVPAVVPVPLPDVFLKTKAAAAILGGALHLIKHKVFLIGPIVGKVIHAKLSLLPNIKHTVAAILGSSSAFPHPVPVATIPVPNPGPVHVPAPVLPVYGAPHL